MGIQEKYKQRIDGMESMGMLKYIALFLLLIAAISPASAWTFSDDFNDCNIADWTLSGSWACGYPSADGTNFTYKSPETTAGTWEMTKTGLSAADAYWEFDINATGNYFGGARAYNRIYFDSTNSEEHYFVLTTTIDGVGFTYSKTLTQNYWYRLSIQKAGTNYIINRYNATNLTLIDTTTTPINVPVSAPDRIKFLSYSLNALYFANLRIDNVHVNPEYPGVGYVIAPETVTLNTEASIYFNYSPVTPFGYSVDVYDPYNTKTSISLLGLGYDGNVTYDTTGKTPGIYNVYLVSTNPDTGVQYFLAHDTMVVQSTVNVHGYTRDAILGNIITNASVNFTQSGSWFNTTSDGTGYYLLTGMVSSYPITVNASKIGYIHLDYTYTPTFDYNYSVDLYLWNTTFHTGDTGIEGVVVKSPFKNKVSGATVNLHNATQSWVLTSDINGYFAQTLANASDTITANATKSGFTTPSDVNVSITNLSWSQVFLNLTPQYTLTIRAKDSVTGGFLSSFNTVIDDGTIIVSNTTTNGVVTNVLGEGVYFVTVSATGYYSSGNYYLLTSNRAIEVSLTPFSTTTSTSVDLISNQVYEKFIVRGLFDNPYPGLTLDVYRGSNLTPVFSNVTDSMGQVVFKLTKDIYYRGVLSGTGITNLTFYFYGKEESYLITIMTGFPSGGDRFHDISANLTTSTFNATYSNLSVIYNDTIASTTALNFYARNLTTNATCTKTSALSVVQLNCTVMASGLYQFGYNATSSTYGFFREDKIINFGAGNTSSALVPTKPPAATTGADRTIMQWGSIMLIVLTASLFSIKTLKLGAIIVPTEALILWVFGWLSADWKLLAVAMVIGVLIYMRMSESKVAYQ